MFVPYLKYWLELRIIQPAPKHAIVAGANLVIRDFPVPARRRSAHDSGFVGMKTGDCLAPGFGMGVEQHPMSEREVEVPIVQHPVVLVTLPFAAKRT